MRVLAVIITAPRGKGEEIARVLAEEGLAACINITQVRSIYRWKGEIHDDAEDLLVVKTTPERFEDLRVRTLEIHPYSLPEIIALPVETGHRPYLEWVSIECFRG